MCEKLWLEVHRPDLQEICWMKSRCDKVEATVTGRMGQFTMRAFVDRGRDRSEPCMT